MYEVLNIKYEIAMNTPSEEVFRLSKYIVTKCLVPQNYEQAKIVYFVDDIDGYDYESFPTKKEAIEYILNLDNTIV